MQAVRCTTGICHDTVDFEVHGMCDVYLFDSVSSVLLSMHVVVLPFILPRMCYLVQLCRVASLSIVCGRCVCAGLAVVVFKFYRLCDHLQFLQQHDDDDYKPTMMIVNQLWNLRGRKN